MSIYHDILKQYWGYSSFRPLQEDIVESAGSGIDTLALMPTGGGKSVTFQVPALAKEGICLVITPLIALMKDQVENLKARKIKAMAIHSGMTRDEINVALDNCVFGGYKFLYLSPERLITRIFRAKVARMHVNLIAVDEAHCISQWGYDFRPSYLQIAELRELLPGVPVLALTATATPRVAKDIMARLAFSNGRLLKKSFERSNLVYLVRKTEDKHRELLRIASGTAGSGVVYVRNRRKTRELAELLVRNGISADFYHAGLQFADRMRKQEEWQQDKIRIMVSTNAFGMGIDKPDVRFVVHTDLPDSPEAYFQEAGRAGRDELPARAILLYSDSDKKQVEQRIEVNFPDFATLRKIYNAVFNYLQVPVGSGKGMSMDFSMGTFLTRNRINALTVASALNILSMEGYFELTDEINNPSRIHFITGRDELYRFQLRNPRFDDFIRLLLRSYTGLFTQYVAIDEALLSKRSGLDRQEVYEFLVRLAAMKIIHYIPRKRDPVITLLEERLEERNIRISADLYRFRKERYLERINQMLSYARSETICRSQFLLAYFGELKASRCGQCDVCTSQGEQLPGAAEFRSLSDRITGSLADGPATLSEIAHRLGMEEEAITVILDMMLEEKRIRRGADLRFELILFS